MPKHFSGLSDHDYQCDCLVVLGRICEYLPDNLADEDKTYQVVLFNDDVHSVDFVVAVLQEIFSLSEEEAYRCMWEAHSTGTSICARGLTKTIARLKADQLLAYRLLSSYEREP